MRFSPPFCSFVCVLSFLFSWYFEVSEQVECGLDEEGNLSLDLILVAERKETEWIGSRRRCRRPLNRVGLPSSKEWSLTFSHTLQSVKNLTVMEVECDGRKMIRMYGWLECDPTQTLGEPRNCPNKTDPLRFHRIYKGKKIILLNGDRTAVRNSPTSDHGLYGSLVTHRSLMDDELFEIQITETINYDKMGSLAIGVVLDPPKDITEKKWLCCAIGQEGVWDAFDNRIELNGRTVKDKYPIRLRNLPAGTHLGVMRKSNGDLHYFVNGLDRGMAANNVPQGVFGYFELIKYATVATVTC